jgi:hypothetical protein
MTTMPTGSFCATIGRETMSRSPDRRDSDAVNGETAAQGMPWAE